MSKVIIPYMYCTDLIILVLIVVIECKFLIRESVLHCSLRTVQYYLNDKVRSVMVRITGLFIP